MGPLLTDEWLTVRRRLRKNREAVNSARTRGVEREERREMRGDMTISVTVAESPSDSNSRCHGLSDCIHTSRGL